LRGDLVTQKRCCINPDIHLFDQELLLEGGDCIN